MKNFRCLHLYPPTFAFQRKFRHAFCCSAVKKVQATTRLTLCPCPIGSVVTVVAPTFLRTLFMPSRLDCFDTSEENQKHDVANSLLCRTIFCKNFSSPPSYHNSVSCPPKFKTGSVIFPVLRLFNFRKVPAIASDFEP